MSASAFDPHEVTAVLLDAGLQIEADEENAYWTMTFEILTREQTAVLVRPPEGNYLLALSPIFTPALELPLDELPARTLRTIIKLQSDSVLAKFSTFRADDDTLYVTISPCPLEAYDGAQLRKRLHACAELAAHIRLALADAD